MTMKTSQCARCGRTLTSAKSISAGLGPRCAKRIASSAAEVMASVPAAQISKAIELIGDSGIVRVSLGTFTVVSSDGQHHYSTTSVSCTCTAGTFGRTCYHRVAARLIAA